MYPILYYMNLFSSDNSTIILRDVAHGKPAEQSSVYGVYSAQRAVDGNLNTFMHTNIEQSPYWMVDLGKIYQIKRIEIFNLIDGPKSTGGLKYLILFFCTTW